MIKNPGVNPMRICFLSGDITRSGGTERVALAIANVFAAMEEKFEIHILSLEHAEKDLFFEAHPEIKVSSILKKVSSKGHKSKYFKIVRTIRKYVKENQIDIIVDVDTILSLYSIPAIAKTNAKHIAWEHFTFHQDLGVKYRNWGRILAGRFSNAIVVLTINDQQQFQTNKRIMRPVQHIYNPLMVNRYSFFEEKPMTKTILSAGRFSHQKGFEMLIDVAEFVFEKHPDWKWVVVGDGEEREKLERKIRKKGLEKHVLLPGLVKNIEDYYLEASMFVLTSRFEPFGLVLTEAKSYHLPCISFDVDSGPAEIISEGINGYLIPPFDVKGMADKINYLIENPKVLKEQAARAMEGTQKFDLEIIKDQWENLFYSMI